MIANLAKEKKEEEKFKLKKASVPRLAEDSYFFEFIPMLGNLSRML